MAEALAMGGPVLLGSVLFRILEGWKGAET